MTAANVTVRVYQDGAVTWDRRELSFEYAATEDRMRIRRSLTLVPLARNVGYAVHVMEWLPRPIFPRFDAF